MLFQKNVIPWQSINKIINVIFTELFELDDELSSSTRDTQNDGSLSE